MKPIGLIGIVLILLGVGALAVRQFSYTTDKPVVALGPLTASVAEQHTVALPNFAGFGLIIVGGVLLLLNRRNV